MGSWSVRSDYDSWYSAPLSSPAVAPSASHAARSTWSVSCASPSGVPCNRLSPGPPGRCKYPRAPKRIPQIDILNGVYHSPREKGVLCSAACSRPASIVPWLHWDARIYPKYNLSNPRDRSISRTLGLRVRPRIGAGAKLSGACCAKSVTARTCRQISISRRIASASYRDSTYSDQFIMLLLNQSRVLRKSHVSSTSASATAPKLGSSTGTWYSFPARRENARSPQQGGPSTGTPSQ